MMFSQIKLAPSLFLIIAISSASIPQSNSATSKPPEDGRLMLTPLISNQRTSEAREKSKVTTIKDDKSESFAGFITVNQILGNHLFFWFFKSNQTKNAPLLFWFNGGPGTSSLNGLFMQHGPFKLDKGLKSYSTRPANETLVGPFSVVYVDSPVGVGFSYSDSGYNGYRTSQEEYGNDLYQFVRQFIEVFPEYKTKLDVYVGGQSYAGKYVLVLAEKLFNGARDNDIEINMKGIFLGGPLIDPVTMFPATEDYAFSLGMISNQQRLDLIQQEAELFARAENGLISPNETSMDVLGPHLNYTIPGAYDNFLSENGFDYNATYYLADIEGVRDALHVGKAEYVSSSDNVYFSMARDIRSSGKSALGMLLENDMKVLIYNGGFDIIVNTNAIEAALLSTPWKGQTAYQKEPRKAWFYPTDNKVAGWYSQTDNLCRVIVYKAGHNVGFEQPLALVEMIKKFVNDGCVQ